MKRILLAACFLGLAPAYAADMGYPVKAPQMRPPNWSGLYIGGNVGYGWSNEVATITGGNPLSTAIITAGLVPANLNTHGDGWIGGATAGYNWDYGFGVLGLESDIQFSNIKGSNSSRFALGAFSVTTNSEATLDWFATIRARLGVFVGHGLLYVTGGAAFGDVSSNTTATLATPIPAFNATATGKKSDMKTGWAAGAGYETPLYGNWTLKGEYLYVDLGSDDVAMNAVVAGAPLAFTVHQEYKYHMTRLGLNYRW